MFKPLIFEGRVQKNNKTEATKCYIACFVHETGWLVYIN